MAAGTKRKTTRVAASSPSPSAAETLATLAKLGSVGVAQIARRYFKTAAGQYAEGDQFLGIKVPVLRALVRDMKGAGLEVALPLLKSGWHEARAVALMLLVRLYERRDADTQKQIFDLYLKSTAFINNWDLVDMSAAPIVGAWLGDNPAEKKSVLTRLAKSASLWERRIAIIATYHYIKHGDGMETLRIAKLLLKDEEDLIHKAVGWMLREVGQRVSQPEEEDFLAATYRQMPRTMLRYAIEKFVEPTRKRYLNGLV